MRESPRYSLATKKNEDLKNEKRTDKFPWPSLAHKTHMVQKTGNEKAKSVFARFSLAFPGPHKRTKQAIIFVVKPLLGPRAL